MGEFHATAQYPYSPIVAHTHPTDPVDALRTNRSQGDELMNHADWEGADQRASHPPSTATVNP